jgi:RNA polymerase sigma factor (sigma-70 family)
MAARSGTFSRVDRPLDPVQRPDPLASLSRVLRASRAGLAAIARAEGLSPEDAVDCVQEGLCTLLELEHRSTDGTDRVDAAASHSDEATRARLAVIVRNAARNRRRRHDRARPHEELEAAEGAGALDAGRGADEAIARAEEHVRLRACVAELCGIQRAVVTLRMLEEQDGEDVATALGITPGYVAVLLHRAKRELRACMTAS